MGREILEQVRYLLNSININEEKLKELLDSQQNSDAVVEAVLNNKNGILLFQELPVVTQDLLGVEDPKLYQNRLDELIEIFEEGAKNKNIIIKYKSIFILESLRATEKFEITDRKTRIARTLPIVIQDGNDITFSILSQELDSELLKKSIEFALKIGQNEIINIAFSKLKEKGGEIEYTADLVLALSYDSFILASKDEKFKEWLKNNKENKENDETKEAIKLVDFYQRREDSKKPGNSPSHPTATMNFLTELKSLLETRYINLLQFNRIVLEDITISSKFCCSYDIPSGIPRFYPVKPSGYRSTRDVNIVQLAAIIYCHTKDPEEKKRANLIVNGLFREFDKKEQKSMICNIELIAALDTKTINQSEGAVIAIKNYFKMNENIANNIAKQTPNVALKRIIGHFGKDKIKLLEMEKLVDDLFQRTKKEVARCL